MTAQRYPREQALVVAQALYDVVAPVCRWAAIAGSLRRGLSHVKDIELVLAPVPERDLLGEERYETTDLDAELELQELSGALLRRPPERWGKRYKAASHQGIPVDIFIVRPPAEWGAVLAIRTGPAELGRELVTRCRDRGLRCTDGRLVDGKGRTVPTPSEEDFFRECGLPYVEPAEREWPPVLIPTTDGRELCCAGQLHDHHSEECTPLQRYAAGRANR